MVIWLNRYLVQASDAFCRLLTASAAFGKRCAVPEAGAPKKTIRLSSAFLAFFSGAATLAPAWRKREGGKAPSSQAPSTREAPNSKLQSGDPGFGACFGRPGIIPL